MKKYFLNYFKIIKAHLLIIILGVVLAAIFTWPFVTKLTTFYIDSGDYAFNGSMLWYNQNAIKTGKIFNQEKYFNGYQYYPQPYTIAYSDHLFVESLIFSPIYWLTDNFIFSLNSLLFLSFILSFIFSYYFVHFFTKNKLASIVGAIIYAFNPIIFAHFPIHMDLLSHYFLPLVFLFFYKFLDKPTFKSAFLFGLFFSLNGLTAVYFLILSIVILPIFAIPFLSYRFARKNLKYFIDLLRSSLVILLFLPILMYFSLPYLQFSNKEISVRRIEETYFFSGRLINWFFTNPDNLIYGNYVKSFEKIRSPGLDTNGKFNYAEETLALNVSPLILFSIGLIFLLRKKQPISLDRLIIAALILVLAYAFILSLGPYFFGWNGQGPYWKLPYYYLYESSFLFKGLRAPNRIQLIFYVPFALFASYGTLYLFKIAKNRFFIMFIFSLIIIILFIENYNLRSYRDTSSSLVHIRSKQTGLEFLNNKNVLHYPVFIPELDGTDSYALTYTLNWFILTGANSINGYSGYVSGEQVSFLTDLKQKLDREELKDLYIINTDYVIIHKDLLEKDQLKNYDKFSSLYNKGKVYDKNNVIIIDLKKYSFKYTKCDFNKDISIKTGVVSIGKTYQNSPVLILKNNSNCYLPSIYMDKYREKTFSIINLYGLTTSRTIDFKLPILIKPFQQIILSEYNNQLKIE